MKLSTAIRLGALLKPQHFGSVQCKSGMVGTCAIGAALDAVGRLRPNAATADIHDLEDMWPIINCEIPSLDWAQGQRMNVVSAIIYLNDVQRWSREAIADWVERLENAGEEPAKSLEPAELALA